VVVRIYEMYTVEGLSIGEIPAGSTPRASRHARPARGGSARLSGPCCATLPIAHCLFRQDARLFPNTCYASAASTGCDYAQHDGGHERPREEWIEIPVPALISEDSFARAQELLEENKIRSRRRTIEPSIVQG